MNPFLQLPDKFAAIEEEDDAEAEKSAGPAADPIDSMCLQLSQELTAAAVTSPAAEPAVCNNSSQQVSESNISGLNPSNHHVCKCVVSCTT